MDGKKDWSKVLQPLLLPLAFIVGIGSFILVADGKTKKTSKPPPESAPPSILMIGDSLSVGKFGEVVQMHLALKHRVAAYASCGSSPEHWLTGEPDFVTKCGYRQRTSDSDIFNDWVNGHAPRPTRTPKLADLVRKHKPTILVVQLGTNWMDRNLSDEQMGEYISRLVDEVRRGTVEKIVWIAPPDSSRLRKTQGRVHQIIRRASARKKFDIIDSRNVTHYVMGKTGGDGIHYNSESSEAWAHAIQRDLDIKIALNRRENKLSSFQREDGAQN
ncbi:MAG TPA: SGNH/GDSL hydrolase family protein [Chthoniobacterales bacterium]|nr:SGNH/GDSL hydrolase family protein [Chthoniobacterales bacterium]